MGSSGARGSCLNCGRVNSNSVLCYYPDCPLYLFPRGSPMRNSCGLPGFAFALSVICSAGCGGGSSSTPPPPPSPDFAVGVAPPTVMLAPGSSGIVVVSVNGANGFNNSVSLSITGLPQEISASTTSFSLSPEVSSKLLSRPLTQQRILPSKYRSRLPPEH